MSRSVQNPKTLTPLINMITPRVQFLNAKYWLVIAALLTGGMIYLGNSNHRVADTNDALGADLQMLVEYLEYGGNRRGTYEPLVPPPTGGLSNMPIIGNTEDWIIWEQTAPERPIRQQDRP